MVGLEAAVNHFVRAKPQNIADSVTSVSSGLIMTLGGLVSRAIMLRVYSSLHQQYGVVSLPWDSPLTWVVTALLLDCGYYWFHRASHEVGLLWAVHQVHHSSQYFNLTTALRQPLLEGLGWLTHWFYLPLALAIPTPQMVVHAEFNFLYQFLIHTELIGDLGPLGLVLNTASHHRVHHGANRYCLDKNYGGWLSVWDRIFGTFQEERPGEEIVYGLVDQPRFFDVIKLQFFYFPLLHNKLGPGMNSSWVERIKCYMFGPGWFPGQDLPRLGDPSLVQERPDRSLHFSEIHWMMHLNSLLQLSTMICIHDEISISFQSLSLPQLSILLVFVFWTVWSLGLTYDQADTAPAVEFSR